MKCILLAAGYAKRLSPLTDNFPKPLLEIEEGKPILDYILEEVNTIEEIDEIAVVTNARYYHHFLEWAKGKIGNPKPIKIVNDHTTSNEDRLGAIGDIQYTIEELNLQDDLLIIAGDSIFEFKLRDYVDFYHQVKSPLIACKVNDDYEALKSFAVVSLDENKKIVNLVEKPSEPASNLAGYAIYLYPKEVIPMIKQYLEEGHKPDAPSYLVEYVYKKTPSYGFVFEEAFFDVGNHESLKLVRDRYQK